MVSHSPKFIVVEYLSSLILIWIFCIFGPFILFEIFKLGRDEFNFAPNDYSNIDQSVEVNLPTLEEIEKAKMYENQIKYPIFDDEKINNDSNGDAAPVTELPTEEEIYHYKKKNE